MSYVFGTYFSELIEVTMFYSLICLLFIETCLAVGIIPNNVNHQQLLKFSLLDMHILTNNFRNEYQTLIAKPLPTEIIDQVSQRNFQANMFNRLFLVNDNTLFYDVLQINGGYAVFKESLEPVLELQKELHNIREVQERKNQELIDAKQIISENVKLATQTKLISSLDIVFKKRLSKVNTIMSTIDAQEDKDVFSKLTEIKSIINYCKRRGNLTILQTEGLLTNTDSLALWLKETLVETEICGITGTVIESPNYSLSIQKAILIYDYFQHIIENCLNYKNAVVLVNINKNNENILVRIIIEIQELKDRKKFEPKEQLRQNFKEENITCDIENEENALIFLLHIQKDEE
jgi:hypothetical protein